MQKNTNECNIRAHVANMYQISDLLHLLHLRNAILIGKQKNSLRQFCIKLVKLQKRAI